MGKLAVIKQTIIKPTLAKIGLSSPASINLVAGIGLVESGYATTRQYGGGPALGYWQMEPATEKDCWVNFLAHRPLLAALVAKTTGVFSSSPNSLVTNPAYAVAMCRIRLYRSPEPLPAYNEATAMCSYWKSIYNSSAGKGQVDAAHIALFQEAIDA